MLCGRGARAYETDPVGLFREFFNEGLIGIVEGVTAACRTLGTEGGGGGGDIGGDGGGGNSVWLLPLGEN